MSTIEQFYNITFGIKRFQAASGNAKPSYSLVASGESGALFPNANREQYRGEGDLSAEYKLLCNYDVDVIENDAIDIGSDKYKVAGVSRHLDREDGTDSYTRIEINTRQPWTGE